MKHAVVGLLAAFFLHQAGQPPQGDGAVAARLTPSDPDKYTECRREKEEWIDETGNEALRLFQLCGLV